MKLAIAVALTACISTDPAQLAQRYERAKFCPVDRVHVGPVPELALAAHPPAPIAPWHEPELPADVAADPERRALWQAQRDGALHAWQAQQRANDQASTVSRTPIYAATGCGGTELFVCHSYRHSVGCDPLADAFSAERLVCRDGRALHAVGDAVGCVDAPPIADPNTCSAACMPASACEHTCIGVACRVTCAEAEVACHADCFDVARDGCRGAGLERFGLCAGVTEQARQLDDARRAIAKTVADVRARLETLQR